jgi:hypothetical protein
MPTRAGLPPERERDMKREEEPRRARKGGKRDVGEKGNKRE